MYWYFQNLSAALEHITGEKALKRKKCKKHRDASSGRRKLDVRNYTSNADKEKKSIRREERPNTRSKLMPAL